MLTRALAKKASIPLELHEGVTTLISRTTFTAENEEDSSEEEEMIWVQCDRKECLKWRKLPHTFKINVDKDWYCDMHPDPSQRSCDIPEEKCYTSGKKYFYYTSFPVGQLVWAKMTGYPQWPAVITPDPWSHNEYSSIETDAEGCIYHVEFLGRPRSHIWISEKQITPYIRRELPLPQRKLTKRLTAAIQEAEALCDLNNHERLEKCEYRIGSISTDARVNSKEQNAHPHRRKNSNSKTSTSLPQLTETKRHVKNEQTLLKTQCSLLTQIWTPSLTTSTIQSCTAQMPNPRLEANEPIISSTISTPILLHGCKDSALLQEKPQTKCSHQAVTTEVPCLEYWNKHLLFEQKSHDINANSCNTLHLIERCRHDQIIPSTTGKQIAADPHLHLNIFYYRSRCFFKLGIKHTQ